ncbi:MAG: DNA internalization-related competence protein ComEC/Rec2 [Rhodoferax sp.]|uniref:DNA internalization-related competence protein ComEC/Rec2 n=1 Tax=Rhodoferax sp. TaxID=50421 RepID=UPI00261B5E75|nr:DNA internalization-related competence protein ComEC/Rec2 [Rhodoferax sp.]MDD5335539.1 DNA internalization-related competence protein ComEC/Rec2 [Rhodoferax sp.]
MHTNPGYHPVLARLLWPLLAGWLLGSGLQLQQRALFADWSYACLLLLAAVLCALATLRTLAPTARTLIAVAAFSLLAFGVTGLRASIFLRDALDSGLEGHDIAVTGVVAAMPQRNDAGLRFRLEVEAAQLKGREVRLPPSIYLGWYAAMNGNHGAALVGPPAEQPGPVVAGERWQMTVRLKAPHGASNPFGFDYELWLWEQGLQATGYVRAGAKDPPPLRLAQTLWHPVERARQRVRDRIFERVSERQNAGLIAALVVGDQNAIDRADWDVFRATGVAHLMSISGLHITMFAWVAALALGWLWRRSGPLCLWLPAPSAAVIGGVMLASAYAFFSGWGVPSQRTVLMLATVALLRLSGKRWPWPQVWLLTCAVVVMTDPWALLQAGFWLSFVAVGVLFATDSGASLKEKTPGKGVAAQGRVAHVAASVGAGFAAGPPQSETAPLGGSAARVAASVGAMFHEQWVITLALTPLTLLLFGQVSVVGLAANALAIPWVTLVITPLAMLGVLLEPLWDLAALAIAALVWYLKLLAALPFATLTVAQAPWWAGFAGVVGGLLLAMKLPWSLRLAGLPLLLPVLLWQAPRPHEGQFELLAPDIGQGSAVIVRTASHALVYDAGPRFSRESDAGHRVLVPLLRALDLPVDLLVLSHRDSDHTGGALALLTMQSKAQLLSSIEMDDELQALRPVQRCLAGQRWRWDGVDFEVLQPRAGDYDNDGKTNAMSCTLRISNGQRSALLTGDIEQAQEARLVAERVNDLKTDLLLVPHHGSKSSSSAGFLDVVQPRIALVQAGYRNRFNHPAQSVLVRYEKRRIQVIDSPHCGAATWQSEQPQEIKCQRTQGLRYWHHRLP